MLYREGFISLFFAKGCSDFFITTSGSGIFSSFLGGIRVSAAALRSGARIRNFFFISVTDGSETRQLHEGNFDCKSWVFRIFIVDVRMIANFNSIDQLLRNPLFALFTKTQPGFLPYFYQVEGSRILRHHQIPEMASHSGDENMRIESFFYN